MTLSQSLSLLQSVTSEHPIPQCSYKTFFSVSLRVALLPHIVRAYKRVASAGAFTPEYSIRLQLVTVPSSASIPILFLESEASQTAVRVTSSGTHVLTPYHLRARNMAASISLSRASDVIAPYVDRVQTPVFDARTSETARPHNPYEECPQEVDSSGTSSASSRSSSPSSRPTFLQAEDRRGSYSCVKEDDCGTP